LNLFQLAVNLLEQCPELLEPGREDCKVFHGFILLTGSEGKCTVQIKTIIF
jgi:hypothetical protein